jgi:integrase/recombinase XerD
MNRNYLKYLVNKGYSRNTIISYIQTLEQYNEFRKINGKKNLKDYCTQLECSKFKPSTINIKIAAINSYIRYKGKNEYLVKPIKFKYVYRTSNIISIEDYEKMCHYLKSNSILNIYLLIRVMSTTGLRVSELVDMRISNIVTGNMEILSKGKKSRKIFFTKKLVNEARELSHKLLANQLFTNKMGKRLSIRGFSWILKKYAIESGINPNNVYPHSFRHMFAKNFLKNNGDLIVLGDILGHSSLNTTRIYLNFSDEETKEIVNKVVSW